MNTDEFLAVKAQLMGVDKHLYSPAQLKALRRLKGVNSLAEMKQQIAKSLKKAGPATAPFGLCAYINKLWWRELGPLAKFMDNELQLLWCTWPSFSGHTAHPVPHDLFTPDVAYSRECAQRRMWEGTYGVMRRSLKQFIIESWENERPPSNHHTTPNGSDKRSVSRDISQQSQKGTTPNPATTYPFFRYERQPWI